MSTAVLEAVLKLGKATWGYVGRKTETGVQILRADGTVAITVNDTDRKKLEEIWALHDRVFGGGRQ